MQDRELYEYLLGLQSPWRVDRVALDIKKQRVDVWAEHGDGVTWKCPQCTRMLGVFDHSEERVWRHLDSCHCQTHLHARPPRVECPEHGVRQVDVPWAEPKSRFTILFERLAIDLLLECGVSGAAKILGISWDEAWGIMKRAVVRGRRRKKKKVVRRLAVDEKAAAKGHKYVTVINDLEEGTVEDVQEDRRQESLEAYYDSLTRRQRYGILSVSMDMWPPYIQGTKAKVPEAAKKIVFDPFHVMGYVNKAVDQVRRREHRELMAAGDETLKRTKYLWLYGRENVPRSRRMEFAELKRMGLKVSRAWAIKELLRDLWGYVYPASARGFWKRWYFWATHSRLQPIRDAAKTIKRHIDNIMTYFQHRFTNAISESINSKIQKIKQKACGFRNIEHFKIAIFFHCGGLKLYPR